MSRPKGFIDWNPKPETQQIVTQVRAVLREYSQYGPMTVRQIFYRLVGNYGHDKTERAYKRLVEYLVKARRARMISFGAIRDDSGTTERGNAGYDSVVEFLESLADYSTRYTLDKTTYQPYHVELWCEAEGMVPMLAQIVSAYDVPVTGTGGFSSVTVTHRFAADVIRRSTPTVLLHVGDYDPSDESIFTSMCQDIGQFVAAHFGGYAHERTGVTDDHEGRRIFIPQRVALTAEQVETYDLPTAPPKATDSRSANWAGETTQAEALPPDLLAQVVASAVEDWVDMDARVELQRRERQERTLIGTRVSDAIERIRAEIADQDGDQP
jgi:hypothetical protein